MFCFLTKNVKLLFSCNLLIYYKENDLCFCSLELLDQHSELIEYKMLIVIFTTIFRIIYFCQLVNC